MPTLSGAALNNELLKRYSVWLSKVGYSPNVQRAYPTVMRAYCDFLAGKEITRTTSWDIREFIIWGSKRGLKYPSIAMFLTALRQFSEFLGLGGIRSQIPVRMVCIKSRPQKLPRTVSPRTISRLIAAARNPRDAAIVELMYATGCRAEELVGIRIEHIDFESRKIRIYGKNHKVRYVVFGDKAAEAVKNYMGDRSSGYLFQSSHMQMGSVHASYDGKWLGAVNVRCDTRPSGRRHVRFHLGPRSEVSFAEAWVLFKNRMRNLDLVRPKTTPMTTGAVRRILNELARRAAIKRITPHQIRHCFATHMMEGGANLRQIQELMGHAFLTSTQIYTHISRRKMIQVFDRCHPRGNQYRASFKAKQKQDFRQDLLHGEEEF